MILCAAGHILYNDTFESETKNLLVPLMILLVNIMFSVAANFYIYYIKTW